MKKLSYLIILALILGLILTGCSLLSNISQVPATEQSGISYLTKGGVPPPPSVDLVGLWHFDEGTGITANDSSGSDNTGTLVNDPLWEVLGKFGSALSFDGMSDYVDCEKNVDITTAITIEAWIKPSAFTDYDAIVTNFEWPTDPEGWSFRVMSNKKLVWRAVLSGNSIYSIISNSTMEADNWYHVVLTHDASYTRLYINGSLDKEENPGGTIVNSGKALKIGWDDYAAERVFNGLIDEVRIWNKALEEPEIAYNYSLRNIAIDIKPGSDPNSINMGSNGVVPVAILGSVDFDAATVNPSTVTLAGAGVKLKGNSGNAGSLEYVNDDQYLDLVVQVYTNQLDVLGDGEIFLTAYTYAGPALTGSDWVRIVPPK